MQIFICLNCNKINAYRCCSRPKSITQNPQIIADNICHELIKIDKEITMSGYSARLKTLKVNLLKRIDALIRYCNLFRIKLVITYAITSP